MMPDYPLGQTLDFKFTSRQFSTGTPFTLASGVVEVYEDNSITQITAGETLTADFDSITGLNNLRIVATGANGYETGKSYSAVLSAGTVDGVSVIGEVVAQFSIERSAIFARVGAPAGASVSADIADIPTVAEFNARTLVAASYFDPAADAVATVTALTGHTAQTGDSFARLGAPAGADVSADILAVKTETALIVGDTAGIAGAAMRGTDSAALASVVGALADAAAAGDPTSADTLMQYMKQLINTLEGAVGIPVYPAAADPANNVSLAEGIRAIRDDVTAIAGAAMRGTDNAALASVVGALADAAAAGDPTSADTAMQYLKQLVNVLVGTDGIAVFPAAAVPANLVSLAEVVRQINDKVNGLTFTVANIVDANILRIDGVAAGATRLQESTSVIFSGQCSGATTTTTLIDSGLTQADTDHWKGRIVIFLDGGLKFQATDITAFDPATDKLTFTAVTTAPTAGPGGTKYIIV